MSESEQLQLEKIPDLDFEFDFFGEEEVIPERRNKERFRPEFQGINGFLRTVTDNIVNRVNSSRIGWVSLVSIIIMAVILLLWSLTFRLQHLGDNFELVSELSGRRSEFAELLAKLSHDDVMNIREKLSDAEISIFPGYGRLAEWLNQQANLAEQFGLDMRYTMAEKTDSYINNVVELPIEIHIRSSDSVLSHSYLHIMQFIKSMVDDQWHLEIVSAAMNGQGQGPSNLTTTIRVWVRELKPTDTPELALENENTE